MSSRFEAEFRKFLDEERHLGRMIRKRVSRYGDTRTAVRHKPYGQWIGYSWEQFGEMIDAAAKALLALGVREGERVGLFSHNRVEWAVCDFACFTVRACSVPVYATNSARELEYIVDDAGIRILFVGNQDQYEKALGLLGQSKTLRTIVVYDETVQIAKLDGAVTFTQFLETGRTSGREKEREERIGRLDPEDLSTLI